MTTTTVAPAPPRATEERALAPDLARGAMLLAIALAHAPLYVTDVRRGPETLNTITDLFCFLFVDNHARPMFAFLFGYALVQLLGRSGADEVGGRRLLRRRGRWLVALGLAHVVLLVPLDILAVYGLASIVLAGLPRRGDRALLWTAGLTLVPATAVVGAGLWFPMSQGLPTYTAGSVAVAGEGFWALLADRLTAWPFGLVAGVLAVVPAIVLGMWAARRRYLEEPARHRRLLLRTAVATTAVSVAGSLPAALVQIGMWAEPSPAALWAAALVQPLTGYAGGIGLAALVALVAIRAQRRRSRLTTMVEALGRRSMTMYLFQSVVFVAVFSPYGLGLQGHLGLAGAALVAALTWLLSLRLADLMRRVGHRGPAELLLRRLAYRS
ncbi:unnamed protein product [[Actinomadura] parvosata subsp. kistnae]|uniref:DUF418 domain-containing protein n=1 Tax=[Actinomadura] parvosata subsp. kistnae TaxID=1909395 RepID=A0A1V0AGK0_9ACTN|nr:DUF418 domain-containing protein [Nonomuraea sp. ATCC 55076]AQZ69338.1 hypothetical protein BKM31_54785 [Nonomuraea sp. ATCC 55076]SPL92026.1 unnamed protein product [Actinomadura parvosata subsp. kistnae]